MNFKVFSVAVCFVSLNLPILAFAAQTGQINITGRVIETSCVLDASSTNVNVVLPTVDKSQLASAQSATGRTGFTLQVTDCPEDAKVSAAFLPDANVNPYGNLVNNAANKASNVEVQLLDQNHTAININTDDDASQALRAVDINGKGSLQYFAQYFSQEGSAGGGDVSVMANFMLTYE
ncbi:hypothetical protein C4K00_2147 [Pseudomonas synxantha]|uniref:fimbrial protein n=1 Tax=Pseudomonas synxantha TaxID=47883 RepID=UPI000F567FAC|nr:fimbrial protein [Pseudomonas synxantha]AZE72376.1 hypothetical protein C4K00_2147 [Pseudomonas synxantha]